MKTKNVIMSVVLMLVTCSVGAVAPFKNVINLTTERQVVLKFSAEDLQHVKLFGEHIYKLRTIIEKLPTPLDQSRPYSISFEPGKSFTVKPKEQTTQLIYVNDSVYKAKPINECTITHKLYTVHISSFDDIENILSDTLIKQVNSTTDTVLAHKGKGVITYDIVIKDGNTKWKSDKRNGTAVESVISGQLGAGIIKNQITTGFDLGLNVIIPYKGVPVMKSYISADLIYLFDHQGNHLINTFACIGLQGNTSSQRDKRKWVGLEFGKLVKRSGDFFKEDTYRLLVTSSRNRMNWHFGIYFDHFFQNVYPAIGVGVPF